MARTTGIDLGTTNAAVATIDGSDQPVRISSGTSERDVPSDQFLGNHGGLANRELGRTMPQLAARLPERQREVRIGPWFYGKLSGFRDDKVRTDGEIGLIGYSYYYSDWPSSVCRSDDGEPFSYGWDAQPYEATPDGRRGVSDWRTRSWHSLYSLIHGDVVHIDEQLGDVGIFDGIDTLYYKHLNEIDSRYFGASVTNSIRVWPGDYLGTMGMRGTAVAPRITLEVRAGLPAHELCPAAGTSASPLPHLYKLLGGR